MRKKRVLTRKRRAIRCLAVLAVLLLVLSVLDVIRVSSVQGLRYMEEIKGTGRTRVVWSGWTPTRQNWHRRFYLSANENAVMLSGCSAIFGAAWNGDVFCGIIDCSAETRAVYGNVSLSGGGRADETVLRLDRPIHTFGRVDDPKIAAVEMHLTLATFEGDGFVYEEILTQRSERSEWMELDGRTYFLMETETLEWEGETFFVPVLRALDAGGNLIEEYNVWNRAG